MRVRSALMLLFITACVPTGERRALRASSQPDSSGRSSAEATLGADAPPPAVSSSVVGGDADAQRDVLEYLGRHLYQSWRPDSAEDSGSDEVCRLDVDLQDGIELNAAHGIARARLLSLTRVDSSPSMTAEVEALRVVSIEGDTAGGKLSSSRDMVVVGQVADTITIDFYRRADGRWIACGPPIKQTAPGSFDDPIALTGPPVDTLNVRGVPSRHMIPAKTSWSRVRALADSLGGPSSATTIQKRVWAGAYVEPEDVAELPEAVKNRLTEMRCLVPLAFSGSDRAPLVGRGALYARGRPDDWAVACSRTSSAVRTSTLYVFGAARGYAADSVYDLGKDVVKDIRRGSGTVVSAHEVLFNVDRGYGPTTFGESMMEDERKSLDLTESEARQLLHDGLMLNLEGYARAYWTGARWVVFYLQD